MSDAEVAAFEKNLPEDTLDEIEEALIASDLGPSVAARVRDRLASGRFDRHLSELDIREIVAEELGLRFADVTVIEGDTDVVPWDIGAFASHTTFMGGKAAQLAAAE